LEIHDTHEFGKLSKMHLHSKLLLYIQTSVSESSSSITAVQCKFAVAQVTQPIQMFGLFASARVAVYTSEYQYPSTTSFKSSKLIIFKEIS
jgi:hypothetical protein